MRSLVRSFVALSALVALSACADSGTGTRDIAPDLTGRWSEQLTLPGSSLIMDLSASGGTITGTGIYAMEAGPSGNVTVTGTYSGRTVELTVHYDFGPAGSFSGTLDLLGHLHGTYFVQDPPYPIPTVVFVKILA